MKSKLFLWILFFLSPQHAFVRCSLIHGSKAKNLEHFVETRSFPLCFFQPIQRVGQLAETDF